MIGSSLLCGTRARRCWATGVLVAWAAAGGAPANAGLVPLFPAASDEFRQGFVRVVNHSTVAGTVTIVAVDDAGTAADALTLALGAGETVHFNSDDLETGNPDKGLTGATGAGDGDWRLELTSGLDIEVLGYIRTEDGFLAAMHDTVPVSAGGHRVVIFNPGSNEQQASRLRLINPGSTPATVTVQGVDDRGVLHGSVELSLPAGSARTVDARELESGGDDFTGELGDGDGKWTLAVDADEPIHAMSLLATPTGHLTNLSTVPTTGRPTVPLFPAAGDSSNRQGFLRVINHSDIEGEVHVTAFDDGGTEHGPVTLSLEARQVVHINSDDLESGNNRKGLTGSTGTGEGDWRLELTSDLDIEVLAYTRIKPSGDGANDAVAGFLTAMHDVAPHANNRHRIAIFNPGSNTNQVSRLRLANPGDEAATVTIMGIDDRGRSPGSEIRTTIPARAALTWSAAELEASQTTRVGDLGNGTGKWRLVVESDRPILAMSLMESAAGLLTNLSTTRDAHRSAANETAQTVFQTLVSESIVQAKCVTCHVRGGQSERTRLIFVPASDADHLMLNFAAFKDFLVDFEDGVTRILDKIQGNDHGGGVQVAAGTEDLANMDRFLDRLAEAASEVTNRRPRVAFIEDQELAIGESVDVTVDVTDGDETDGYSVEANAPANCVSELAAVNGTVTLTGLLAGSIDVTVRATDDSGADNATSAARTFAVEVRHPVAPEWALTRTAAAEVGVSTCAVADVLDHVFTDQALQAALLLRDGQVVGERYADGYGVEDLVTSWSVAKSIYSAAIGIAIDEGHIESLDQKASDFLDEWLDTDKEDITIRNLLEMRAGFANANVFIQADQTEFSLDQPLINEPGSTFLYSSNNSQLFEPLLRRATGVNAHLWLTDKILKPLGIDETAIGLWLDPTGVNPLTYCCIDMRADDFARIGVLFANGGVWNGETVIPADYVDSSLAARVGWYGLQWWVLNTIYFRGVEPPIDVSAAHGLDGQHIFVWRDEGIVLVVFTQYEHEASQGHVLSLVNYPSTCAARNNCPLSTGSPVRPYNEYDLLGHIARLR
ncbi:MAG: serine hydrolase [Gammaproteobacteria bacterium]|nr:serine hydrolase [Gammaproteobacteria bacterium]